MKFVLAAVIFSGAFLIGPGAADAGCLGGRCRLIDNGPRIVRAAPLRVLRAPLRVLRAPFRALRAIRPFRRCG